MDRISKKDTFSKVDFPYISNSIFYLHFVLLQAISPQTSGFFIKIITNALVQKKNPSLVSELSDALIGHVQLGLKGCHHLPTKPTEFHQPSGECPPGNFNKPRKTPKNIPKDFWSQFFWDFLMMSFIELVRKTNMFHKPTKKHVDSATFSFHHGGSILLPNVPLSENRLSIQGSYLEIPQYSTFFVHLSNAK